MTDTKLDIFMAAVNLFYERGYSNVGMRDIATVVGIKSASIYNHFANKEALLERMYDFYYDNYETGLLDINDAINLVPSTPPHEILERLAMPLQVYGVYDTLKKIIMIAEYECNNDARAKAIVSDMFNIATGRIAKVLDAMIEQNVIEPIDVDLFASVLVRYGLSSASHVESLRNLSLPEWRAGHRLLFKLVKAKK